MKNLNRTIVFSALLVAFTVSAGGNNTDMQTLGSGHGAIPDPTKSDQSISNRNKSVVVSNQKEFENKKFCIKGVCFEF